MKPFLATHGDYGGVFNLGRGEVIVKLYLVNFDNGYDYSDNENYDVAVFDSRVGRE
jgi:hypothetical protein